VTWLLNGTHIDQHGRSSLGATVTSDRGVRCSPSAEDSGELRTYTTLMKIVPTSLAPFTVQCTVVRICVGADDAGCQHRVCNGRLVHVEGRPDRFSIPLHQHACNYHAHNKEIVGY
jgi:hypothetical protein